MREVKLVKVRGVMKAFHAHSFHTLPYTRDTLGA